MSVTALAIAQLRAQVGHLAYWSGQGAFTQFRKDTAKQMCLAALADAEEDAEQVAERETSRRTSLRGGIVGRQEARKS